FTRARLDRGPHHAESDQREAAAREIDDVLRGPVTLEAPLGEGTLVRVRAVALLHEIYSVEHPVAAELVPDSEPIRDKAHRCLSLLLVVPRCIRRHHIGKPASRPG